MISFYMISILWKFGIIIREYGITYCNILSDSTQIRGQFNVLCYEAILLYYCYIVPSSCIFFYLANHARRNIR